MKLGTSRNQGKSLGMECCCSDQEPALEGGHQGGNRNGKCDITGRQQSQAEAVVALW